jgi:tetratricopeptide (TPR) repeat protein
MSGDFGEAAARFAEQVSRTELILRAEPDNARWKGRLADALSLHSSILAITGRAAEAMECRLRARSLLESLVAGDPQNHTWLRLLLWARLREVEFLRANGDLTAAATLCDELRETFEQLLAAEPKDQRMEERLSFAYRLQGDLRAALGRDGSSEAAARAVELAERLLSVRQTYTYVSACAQAHLTAGKIAAGQGKPDAAQQHWRRALELLEPRLPGSNHWRILYPAAEAYRRVGRQAESDSLVERLQRLGFRPLEPWPDSVATAPLPRKLEP